MALSRNEQHSLTNSQFRDHTVIHQGNIEGNFAVNYGLPHQPAHSATIRVIPYPRNEDLIRRRDLIERLNGLLPSTGSGSAALWGLGGSGYVIAFGIAASCFVKILKSPT